MNSIQCKLAESVELCPGEEKIVNVRVDRLIGINEMIEARSEVSGLTVNGQDTDCLAYGTVGDGSDSVLLMVRNELNCGTLLKGVITGRANCSTMEITTDTEDARQSQNISSRDCHGSQLSSHT